MLKKENKTEGLSLSYKLVLIMLAISLIPLSISAYLNLTGSGEALKETSFKQLTAIRTIKANQIESFFAERKADISVLSETPIIKESVTNFNQAYQSQGINGSKYKSLVNHYSSYFEQYLTSSPPVR